MTTRGSSVFSGEPLPIAPKVKDPEIDAFYRKLLDYLRRLAAKLGRFIDQPGGNGGGIESAAMIKANTQVLTGTGTFDVITWGTIFWQDAPFTLADETVTINETGRYLLHVDLAFGKTTATMKVTQNDNDITHSFSYGYDPAVDALTMASSVPLALTAGDVIKILCEGNVGNTIFADGSRLTILRLDPVEGTGDGDGTDAAPLTESYVVITLSDALTHERRLQTESGVLSLTDGGANADVTIGVSTNGLDYEKIQIVTASRLLGRGSAAGDGNVEELTVSTGLSLSGTDLSCTLIGLTDGDKGDITVSASGVTWTIDNDVVTFGKMQNSATGFSVLGKATTGSGDFAEIKAGTDSVCMRSGSGNITFGTIVTNQIGALQVTAAKIASLTSAELRTICSDETGTSGGLVFAGSPTLITPNLGTPSAGVLTNCTGLPVAGGGTGAATLTGILQGNGTSAITGLASSTVGQVLRVTGAGTYAWGAVDLADTDAVTGILVVANGGTGRATHTAYSVICGGTTTTAAQQSVVSVGTAGQILTSNGAGALPTFQDSPASSGITGSGASGQLAVFNGSVSLESFVNLNYDDGAGASGDGSLTVRGLVLSDLLKIRETVSGNPGTSGSATLVGGTVTVSTAYVTANSRIHLTVQTAGGTQGHLRISARSAGTSFTITSTSGTETSAVAWLIIEPE